MKLTLPQKVTVWIVVAFFTTLSVYSPLLAAPPEEIFIGEESKKTGSQSRTISSANTSLVIYHTFNPKVKQSDIRLESIVKGTTPVKKVTIFYRIKGADGFKKKRMIKVSENRYEGIIPEKDVAELGMEYYLSATGKSGGMAYDGSSEIPYYVQVISAVSGSAESQATTRSKKSNWWKWTLGAVVVGGAVAAAAGLSSSSSSSPGSGGSGGSGTGSGGSTSDTGKITGVWR